MTVRSIKKHFISEKMQDLLDILKRETRVSRKEIGINKNLLKQD